LRRKSSRMPRISQRHGLKLKSTKLSTQMLIRFQIANFQLTLTGETWRELISPVSIETKVTAVLATLFLSHKLLKWDLNWNMDKACQKSHLNI
jgi:hypothetical protein